MSRGIPPVRAWRVTLWRDGKPVASAQVQAINKRFARWAGRDALGWLAWSQADKVTIALWH
jgi:hypothetical protein